MLSSDRVLSSDLFQIQYSVLPVLLSCRTHHYPHFSDEEAEANSEVKQFAQGHRVEVANLGLEPELSASSPHSDPPVQQTLTSQSVQIINTYVAGTMAFIAFLFLGAYSRCSINA